MGRPRTTPPAKGALEAAIAAQLRGWLDKAIRRPMAQSAQYKVLEKRSGVSDTTIAEIMKGTRSARIDNLAALAQALGYTLLDLFQAIENKQQPESGTQDGTASSGELQRHRNQPTPRPQIK